MDWTHHLRWARQHHRHGQSPQLLDPTIHWAIIQQHAVPNIVTVRNDILNEIQDLILDWEATTSRWFNTLPPHSHQAYNQPKMITQIPVLHHLLQSIQYPPVDILYHELTQGFPVIGQLRPGPNGKVQIGGKHPLFLYNTILTHTHSLSNLYQTQRQLCSSIQH